MPPSISTVSSEERSDTRSRKLPSGDDRPRTIYPLSPFDAAKLSDHFIPTFAGATAGLVSAVITCPLDVIKTKLQAQGGWARTSRKADMSGKPRYSGLTGSARMIWRDEGIRGMYRGLGPLILGYLPTWMVYFTVYERAKGILEKDIGKTPVTHLLSSIAAGATSTVCTNPIWVIKTRLMSQASYPSPATLHSPYHYTSTLDAIRKMYTHEGLRSFYSGLAPALLGLTHVAVQFPLYEQFKRLFTGGIELGKQGEGGKMDFVGILAASCLSKICASSATYPHEVLRTRLQTQRILSESNDSSNRQKGPKRGNPYPRYQGIIRSIRTIYKEEGWRAFYAGMGTNMVRAVPASAVTLLTYELVVGTLRRKKEDALASQGAL